MRTAEVLAAVLQPALSLVAEATNSEYEMIILPTFKYVPRRRIVFLDFFTVSNLPF